MRTLRRAAVAVAAVICPVMLWGAPTAVASQSEVHRLAIIGDSLTTGYGVRPDQSYVARMEAREAGDNILPLAHDGATVRAWLTVYRQELVKLAAWRPSSVLIALGGNDYYRSRSTVDYAANLIELIGVVRTTVPTAQVILWHYYRIGATPVHTLCDADQCDPASPSPTWQQYGAAMRSVATTTVAGYIDNSTERPWITEFPLPGESPHIHLSWQGHRALERSLYPRLAHCC